MKLGVQIFGCLGECKKDPEGFFKKLAESGYDQVEPCIAVGYDMANPPAGMEALLDIVWTAEKIRAYMPLLKKYRLSLTSVHIFSQDAAACMDELIAAAKEFGIKQYVMNCPTEINEEVIDDFSATLVGMAEKLKEAGVALWLHNSFPPILWQKDGKTAYEIILEKCGGLVGAQVDVGWVQFGGVQPGAFLTQIKDYVKSIHYKDLSGDHTQIDPAENKCCLGDGILNYASVRMWASYSGKKLTQLVDQDRSAGDIMEDLRLSAERLDAVIPVRDQADIVSILETVDVETGERTVLKEFDGVVIEAPNWLKTKNALLYNSRGRIYEFDLDKKEERLVDTGHCIYCNNDHVLSPDHKYIAVSHQTREDYQSRIYVIPLEPKEGETVVPTLVTPIAPSYLHGWSPDGKTLAYCAFRQGQPDIYTIPVQGGLETQLTDEPGLDDGPEYSPDGKYIWFNSTRSGLMQIWRMEADGANPTQMTTDENNSWFAHLSPDGTQVAYVTYYKGDVDPGDHPANKNVEIRIMPVEGGEYRTLVKLFGGQGTLNVNSWSPDGKKLAFVSYRLK